MADNILLNAGSGGATLATDQNGAAEHYQLVKLVHGGLDSFTLVSTSSGLPVQQQGTFTHTKNQAAAPAATTMQSAAVANGNGTNLNVAGYATAILNIVTSVDASGGTTMNFEASVDDTTFVPIYANQVGTATIATTALNNAMEADWEINCAGYKSVRARISAYSAGTITVKGYPIAEAGAAKALHANQAGTWNIGTVTAVTAISNALPAGANNIGDVDVLTIAAGDNNIGNVDIVTMPNVTLAAGTNTNEVVGDAAHDAAAAGNPILLGAYASAAAPTDVSADADAVRLWALRNGAMAVNVTAAGALIGGDATNGLDVDVTRVTGTVAVTESGTWTVQPGNTANTTPWLVTNTPATSGGWTTYHLASAASTNATNVKASAGQLGGWFIYNSNAAVRKVAFHNSASTPTAGASIYFTVPIPPTSGANVEFTNGIPFSSGIGFTTVTGLGDSDATAVAANDLIVNLWYK